MIKIYNNKEIEITVFGIGTRPQSGKSSVVEGRQAGYWSGVMSERMT